MTYNPDIHHRRSVRLKEYDYSSLGAYFVTICVQGQECLFGDIVNGGMRLNDAGRMLFKWWAKLADKFPGIALDEFVVMPNHFHGIVVIIGADLCVCPDFTSPGICQAGKDTYIEKGAHMGAPLQRIVQWVKTMTTNAYIRGVTTNGWPPFSGRLWQRSYYDRIIRDENELAAVREYIRCNPLKWKHDKENPANSAM